MIYTIIIIPVVIMEIPVTSRLVFCCVGLTTWNNTVGWVHWDEELEFIMYDLKHEFSFFDSSVSSWTTANCANTNSLERSYVLLNTSVPCTLHRQQLSLR